MSDLLEDKLDKSFLNKPVFEMDRTERSHLKRLIKAKRAEKDRNPQAVVIRDSGDRQSPSNMSDQELERERRELISTRRCLKVTRRGFLGTFLAAVGGLAFGSYKLYNFAFTQFNEYSDEFDLFQLGGGEGRLDFLDRSFDSPADYAEFVAGIDYQELSHDERKLAEGLSYFWSPRIGGVSKSELSSEAADLADELMQVVRNPQSETPNWVLRRSDEYLYEYNAAKMMIYELANDIYQEGGGDAWDRTEDWIMHSLIDGIDMSDLEDTSGIVDSYDVVNRYLEEKHGGKPGLRLLEDTFDAIE